jgi:hypothetical protein
MAVHPLQPDPRRPCNATPEEVKAGLANLDEALEAADRYYEE